MQQAIIEELRKVLDHLEKAKRKLAQTKKSPPAWNAFFMISGMVEGVHVALRLLAEDKEEPCKP